MSGNRSAGVVSYARELERQDAEVAARIDSVVGILDRVDAIRAGARRVRDVLDALPAAIAVAEQSERDAVAREVGARAELAEAEQRRAEVDGSRRASDEAKTEAARAARRAAVAATDAAETVARMRVRVRALAADAVALEGEAAGIAVEAQQVAREVAAVPRLSDSGRAAPDGSSLAEIGDWAARAHAALFVVRGGLEGEREKVVVEAHALAEAALGEQTAGVSVALVRRRLEESLAEG